MQEALRPLRFVAKIVGIAPYTFIMNTENGEVTVNISWKYNRRSVVWSLLLLTVGTASALYKITQNSIKHLESVTRLVSTSLVIACVYVSGLVPIFLGLTTYRKGMLKLVKILSTLDKCLIRHSDNMNKEHEAKILTFLMCFIVLIIAMHGLIIFSWKNYGILSGLILCFADLTWLINDISIVITVMLLKERLSIMNKNIETILIAELYRYNVANKSNSRVARSRMHRLLTASRLGHVSEFVEQRSILHHDVQNSVLTVKAVSSCHQQKIIAIIATYRKIYQRLYDVCCLINSMHGLSLLLSTISHTLRFISEVYHAIYFLIIPYSSISGRDSKTEIMLLIICSLITSIRMISIPFACHKTCEEYQKCIDIIQELLLRSDQKDITSNLKLFSSQLENNRIEFTAYGFFVVNLSLLTTLMGVTVTYVILFIQS
ncbi:hypothetical protein L798_12331 [Zootermopsis nevadensis]|uniref:Gustatory receptor n=1 Tax=Zootermopsis nevadensis TaxID=136037 RepID=A0A067R671_ZOONE|nr:hypothetical protein L798_12331 [Zootermopsis nevadensis]